MPRPRIHEFWISEIRVCFANQPESSAAEIGRQLDKLKKDAPTSVPSNRAILRVMTEFRSMPPQDQDRYKYFTWPGSMESGAIPWEASRTCLDLLAYLNQIGRGPLMNAFAERFWRVTQAIPDAPIEERLDAAKLATMIPALIKKVGLDPAILQWRLAYQPWRSENDQRAYETLPDELRHVHGSSPIPFDDFERNVALFGRAIIDTPRQAKAARVKDHRNEKRGAKHGRQRSTKR